MDENRMKIVVKAKQDIAKIPVEVGQLWYHDSGNEFVLITRIGSSEHREGENCAYYVKWDWKKSKWGTKENSQRIIYEGTTIEYCKRVYLADGETPEQAIKSLLEDMVEYFMDPSKLEKQSEEESEETGIMVVHTKDHYQNIMEVVQRQRSRAEIIANMVSRRADVIRWQAQAIAKKLHKVMKIIGMLEVYLGVEEEIFQITAGQPASAKEPISIRQLVLYMDEEAGLARYYSSKKGLIVEPLINFANIEVFDEWLTQDDNLEIVLPEKKGIVALRPSRQKVYYQAEDFWTKAQKEAADSMMYLLVRNGENLYRIWTSIPTGKLFFPTESESASIAALFESNSSWEKEKAQDAQSEWLTNTLLVQGLVDRTEVFHPMESRIVLTDPETYEENGMVRLVRDAENLLSDGKPRFRDWFGELNKTTERGSRVYFKGAHREYGRDATNTDRFLGWRNWAPDFPSPGIYTIEEVVKPSNWNSQRYRILYFPGDEIFDSEEWEFRQRKKRLSFLIYNDEFINYDNFLPEDIDYYIKNRLERANFTEIMPLLLGLKEKREKELEEEKSFVKLFAQKHGFNEKEVFRAVEWWKRKVINKRPIAQDDKKAWRMIVKKLKKEK